MGINDFFLTLDGQMNGAVPALDIFLALLTAFALGQVLAWTYYATHNGLSYSRGFVQSIILITVVVAMVMSAIGNSLITAMGLMGALTIIRFRNMVKDTRDIAFIFCALVVGMATGAQRYSVALIGTLFIVLIVIYLHLSDFGAHQPQNGFLRFRLGESMGKEHPIFLILNQFCVMQTLISVQDEGTHGTEYAYRLTLRNSGTTQQMMTDLEGVMGISSVNLTVQEQLLEL